MEFTSSCSGSGKISLKSRASHTQVGILCPGFRADLCMGGRDMPQNWGISMHGRQRLEPDLGEGYARGAETCLRFRAYLCTGVQRHDPDSGQTYARRADTCLSFEADFCTGCIDMTQICGRLLHGVHRRVPDLGLGNEE